MSLKNWSTTAASNASVDSINFAEGMLPSSVNDSARALMVDVRAALYTKGSDVASATTTDLAAATTEGLIHSVTGVTTITGLGTVAAGVWKVVVFAGALTLTHNATSLILPGGANITTAAGDCAIFESEGSGNWRCISYTRASGLGVKAGSPALTSGRVPYATTGGVLTDSASITTDGTTLTLGGAGTALSVTNNATIGGTLTISVGGSSATALQLTNTSAGVGMTIGGDTNLYRASANNLATDDLFTANAGLTIASGQTLTLTGATVAGAPTWSSTQSLNTSGTAATVTSAAQAAITSVGTISTDFQPLGSSIPQNSQSAAYTTVAGDANKHILHPTADNNPRTFTIDSNANVAYKIGTCITFVNQINTVTIAITTDTMTLAGTATTGSRTLAANGMATALKIAATEWIISGTGLS